MRKRRKRRRFSMRKQARTEQELENGGGREK